MRVAAAISAALVLSACHSSSGGGGDVPVTEQSLDVTVQQGALHGVLRDSTRVFLGLPYAAPPTGENRFRAPQPAAAWTGTRPADQYGPMCPQFGLDNKVVANASEDCLSLNVWTPQRIGKKVPVMFYIHGGGFTSGTGSDQLFDGQHLSEAGDVVVVTINYRLGPLGFLAHPALQAEDPARGGSGNWGLEDQQFAMKWVHDNIAAFGGDPANVTIFGESAGAISVCDQLVSPKTAGLFQRAIIESGACVILPPSSQATADQEGQALASAVSCTDTDPAALRACLRSKSADDILNALPRKAEIIFGDGYGWMPNVDSYLLTDAPAKRLAAGQFQKVPLLIGANKDEGTMFAALGLKLDTEQDVRAALATLYPQPVIDAVVSHYSPLVAGTGVQILGDAFVCDARHVARAYSGASVPTFYYHFTHPFQFIKPNLGAFHSGELPYVFDDPYYGLTVADDDQPLVTTMQGYWTRFAASADPNTGAPMGTVAWPEYTAQTDTNITLDLDVTTGTGLRKAACDFWESVLQ